MKKKIDVARAWRDADYYQSLSEADRAQLPANPAGVAEVDDEVLQGISGGCSCLCCSWLISCREQEEFIQN